MPETYQRPSCSTAVTGSENSRPDSVSSTPSISSNTSPKLSVNSSPTGSSSPLTVTVASAVIVMLAMSATFVVATSTERSSSTTSKPSMPSSDAPSLTTSSRCSSATNSDSGSPNVSRSPGRRRSITPRRSSWASDSITASPSSWGLAAPPLLSPAIWVTANTPAAPIASTPMTPPINTFRLRPLPASSVGPSSPPLPLSSALVDGGANDAGVNGAGVSGGGAGCPPGGSQPAVDSSLMAPQGNRPVAANDVHPPGTTPPCDAGSPRRYSRDAHAYRHHRCHGAHRLRARRRPARQR